MEQSVLLGFPLPLILAGDVTALQNLLVQIIEVVNCCRFVDQDNISRLEERVS